VKLNLLTENKPSNSLASYKWCSKWHFSAVEVFNCRVCDMENGFCSHWILHVS